MPKIGLTVLTVLASDNNKSKEQIKKFKEDCRRIDGKIFSFAGIVPVPKEMDEWDETSKYDWYLLNWGTNCDAIDPEITVTSELELKYKYYSAWSPPQKFVLNASRRFTDLKFIFEYEMNYLCQKGKQEIKDGKVVISEGNGIFLDDHSMKLLLLQIHNMSGREEEPDLRL